MIDINKKSLYITNSSMAKIIEPFVVFDINKFKVDTTENTDFLVKLAFSQDGKNWSTGIDITEFTDIHSALNIDIPDFNSFLETDIYISVWFEKIIDKLNKSTLDQKFGNSTIPKIKLENIKYDNVEIAFKIETLEILTNRFPHWNLYDNQQPIIKNWLAQCCAIAQMYGHHSVYFKSEVTEINETLATNVNREIVSIKKIPVQFPGNELPQDRNVYSDWDYPLMDEIMIHVVDELFKLAFGFDAFPQAGDFIYVPLINKLFKVTAVQPKNGFMGKIGWWEVFLGKYEDDETLGMSSELHNNFQQFEEYGGFEDYDGIIEELEDIEEETVLTAEKILTNTIDEKKEVNQNFTNKLVDSNSYIDLKETDNQRKFYSKRLQIVSINPGTNAFPVTMYDCSTIDRNVIGLTYDLKNAVSVNKKSLILINEFSISFNFVLTKTFTGTLVNTEHFNINCKKNKLNIFDINNQKTFEIEFPVEFNEYYQLNISYNKTLKQYSVIIFILRNKQKRLEYQNLYIMNQEQPKIIGFAEIHLMGGNFFIGEILFTIDNNKIISDFVNPILNMQKF